MKSFIHTYHANFYHLLYESKNYLVLQMSNKFGLEFKLQLETFVKKCTIKHCKRFFQQCPKLGYTVQNFQKLSLKNSFISCHIEFSIRSLTQYDQVQLDCHSRQLIKTALPPLQKLFSNKGCCDHRPWRQGKVFQ
jgi:hypothetical protein